MNSWLPVVIVLMAVAMVVGPVMLMQPSARQRREASLRSRAESLGLRVHLLPLPGSKTPGQLSPAYCLPWRRDNADLSAWLLVRGNYEHALNFSGVWQWQQGMEAGSAWHEPVLKLLPQLPACVQAVGNGPQGLCLYWDELGGSGRVDELGDWLSRLAAVS